MPLDARALTRFLENQPPGVYRIKGFVNFEIPGYTGKFEIQSVGDHVRITPLRWKSGGTSNHATGRDRYRDGFGSGRQRTPRLRARGNGRTAPRRHAGIAPLYRRGVSESAVSVYEAIRRRRDVRAEFSGEVIPDETLMRILDAAHRAPSVGNTQPWDFVVVRNPETLNTFAAHVADARLKFAQSLPEDRRSTFDPIKIEGIAESGTGIVVTYDPSRGGPEHPRPSYRRRHRDCSRAVLAIQNLWLAAVAEEIGIGWVSFYDEK